MKKLALLRKEITKKGNVRRAHISRGFFKTGPGEYGEGDVFIGLTVPQCRLLAKKYQGISLKEIEQLLRSTIHEERLISLLFLLDLFKEGDEQRQKTIYNFYLRSTRWINNWDLVDLSAEKIVGAYLLKRPKQILRRLAKSKNVWERAKELKTNLRNAAFIVALERIERAIKTPLN